MNIVVRQSFSPLPICPEQRGAKPAGSGTWMFLTISILSPCSEKNWLSAGPIYLVLTGPGYMTCLPDAACYHQRRQINTWSLLTIRRTPVRFILIR